ncbi:hypothetical protein AMTRI_Chr12g239120 [Amborella trichopoda]
MNWLLIVFFFLNHLTNLVSIDSLIELTSSIREQRRVFWQNRPVLSNNQPILMPLNFKFFF